VKDTNDAKDDNRHALPGCSFPLGAISLTRANLSAIIKKTRTGDEPGRAEEIPEWLWKARIRATLKHISAGTCGRRQAIYPQIERQALIPIRQNAVYRLTLFHSYFPKPL
jgi:hypothetical protein